MKLPRNLDKNVVIVLALVAAGFVAAYLRFRPYLGREATYTDGSREYSVASGERLRYAVWDRPEALGPSVNTEADESRPAVSPDGRFLVFAVGKLGLNCDLWMSELVGGVPAEPHPLSALDTEFDECSPAFADGVLVFASNRPGGAGGLDLWRAPYSDGAFGEAESLGPDVNTPADECDPAPVPGSRAIAFASNRARGARRDFDLWLAAPGAAAVAIDALNSPADERDPAFAAEGRALLFASNRPGGAGDFDLYRSVLGESGWMAPEPLSDLDTDGAERGPAPSADAFSMYFARQRAGGSSDLFRARSLELLRVPGRPVGWQELTLLTLLLLVALFAMLAKRWNKLDVIYKCLLVSLLLHVALLLLFRELVVGTGAPAPMPRRPEGLVRVRPLDAIDAAVDGSRERGGRLDGDRAGAGAGGDEVAEGPKRAEPGGVPGVEPAAPAASLARGDAPADAGPERMGGAVSQANAPRPSAVPLGVGESVQRLDGGAPNLDVAARSTGAARSGGGEGGEPGREVVATGPLPGAGPGGGGLARGSSPAESAPGRGRGGVARGPGDSGTGGAEAIGVDVAEPHEGVARSGGSAPELSLSPGGSLVRVSAEGSGPARGAGGAGGGGGANAGAPDVGAPAALALAPVRGGSGDGEATGGGARGAPGVAGPTGAGKRAVPGVALHDQVALERIGSGDGGAGATGGGGSGGEIAPLAKSAGRSGGSGDGGDGPGRRAIGLGATEGADLETPGTGSGRMALPGRGEGAGGGDDAAGATARRGGPSIGAPAGGGSGPAVAVRGPRETSGPAIGAGGGGGDGSPEALAIGPRSLGGRARGDGDGDGGSGPSRLSLGAGGDGGGDATASPAPATRGIEPPARAGGDDLDGSGTGRGGRGDSGAAPALARGLPAVAVRGPAEAGVAGGGDARPADGESGGDGLSLAPRSLGRRGSGSGDGEGGGPRLARVVDASASIVGDARPTSRPVDVAPAATATAASPETRGRLDATPYRNRFGPEKEIALRDHGGSEETENAVTNGLAYLARIQSPAGNWGDPEHVDEKYGQVMVGKSALCLLAFLGAGHTPGSSSKHAAVAERAVAFLLSEQDERTGHFGNTAAYSHGIATYALAECYALTKDAKLRRPLERAVRHILDNQNRQSRDPKRFGGWSYYYPDGHVFDSWPRCSITAWQVMALESARLGGIEVPDRAFDDAKAFLLGAYDRRRGYFRYSHDPERLNSEYRTLPGSTPAALFALSLVGEDPKSARFDKAREFVLDRAPDGYRYTSDADFVERGMGNLYFWYYGTLALFRCEGDEWELWNAKMKKTLLPSQDKDGSWRPIDLYARYAGDDRNDRSYTTAMCVLALEVYYRYFTPLLKVR
jgi:WD40 repeat protein